MDNTLSKFIKDFQDLTLKEWQGEMAAVKQTLNDIVVLLQSTNEKITKISEAIATSNGDSNNNIFWVYRLVDSRRRWRDDVMEDSTANLG